MESYLQWFKKDQTMWGGLNKFDYPLKKVFFFNI